MDKKIFLVLAVLSLMLNPCHSQNIQQLYISPAQPTTSDFIQVIADVQFSSGDCKDKTLVYSLPGQNRYEIGFLHCVGILSVICYDSDTFNLGLLPAGNYRCVFHVDAGAGPLPCTPGIVPGPTDSIDFTVTTASAIDEIRKRSFTVSPNPSTGIFNLIFSEAGSYLGLRINQMNGKLVYYTDEVRKEMQVNLSNFDNGIYFLEALTEGGNVQREKLLVNH